MKRTPRPFEAATELRDFHLTRQLPHLLRRAHFQAEASFAPLFGDHITSRQLALLVAVGKMPGESQSAIAQRIGLDLNTCSDLVARTVAKSLLRRERSKADARVHCLYLTATGQSVVSKALPDTAAYEREVARRLTPRQCRDLVDLLRQLLGFEGDADTVTAPQNPVASASKFE